MKTHFLATFLFFFAFSSPIFAQNDVVEEAEQMPYFKGCDAFAIGSVEKRSCSNQAVFAFIADSLQIPKEAEDKNIEGTVYVSFVIDEKGAVADAKILRDIGAGCGAAALVVVKKMPNWSPALVGGKPVKIRMNLPVKFVIKEAIPEFSGGYKLSWGLATSNRLAAKDMQRNMTNPIIVRDESGSIVEVSELLIEKEKDGKFYDAISNGKLTPDQQSILRRLRKGDMLTITATVQKNGNFYYVERVFSID